MNREVENEPIQTAKELGVQILANGTVGHGILIDKFFSDSANNPMLNRDVLAKEHKNNNLRVLMQMNELAESKGLFISELAIAWTQSKYNHVPL